MLQKKFYEIVCEQLDRQVHEEEATIEQAAQYCADAISGGGLIHVFGCGHSQMFAMEVFYRAGGLVPVNALLHPAYALFPKAKMSTIGERVEGFADEYLNLQCTKPGDAMIIASISGRNAGVVDMAIEERKRGMKVIALTSKSFTEKVSSRHSSGKKLIDVADVVIDIKCVEGDACLSLPEMPEKFNGTSTILSMVVMDSITSRTIELCVEKGFIPPTWVSSNLDRGDEINAAYIEEYRTKIDCL